MKKDKKVRVQRGVGHGNLKMIERVGHKVKAELVMYETQGRMVVGGMLYEWMGVRR